MTIQRAKLYKTASITTDTNCEIPEGFKHGEIIGVTFLRKTNGECIFQCSNIYQTAAIGEFSLERFVF